VSEQLLSSSWYRVAGLQPRLRSHARLHRMRYRGGLWYLLQDPVSNRVHRFSPQARFLIAAMDGRRTVQQLWEVANRQLGEDAPTQDEVIRLLGQLHSADLLQSDATPDVSELFERGRKQERSVRQRSWLNPMAIRLHLFDPDAALNRMRPFIDLAWSRWGGLVWLAVVLPALVLVAPHWDELTGSFSDRVLASGNLLLLWLVFPLIKALHEFGHAAATKRGGGEVHDLGVILLVMIPVPYAEASAANVFRSKYHRAGVAAAGMAVELFLAALAFYLWLLVEPGVTRAILFNVMVVAGVSTLIFNGNPLLRYDAYYILSDLIEMPNLGARATRYWGYLAERYVFGATEASTPETQRREKAWLVVYGLLSTLYRIFVTIAIALFIANEFFFIGVLLALWAVVTMAVAPVYKALRHVAGSGTLRPHRNRVVGVAIGTAVAVALLLFVVPAPSRTVVEGVAWLPQSALVRAGQDGFLEQLVAQPGTLVQPGDVLARARNPAVESQYRVASAKVAELEATYLMQLQSDRAQAAIAMDQLESERASLVTARERFEALTLRAQGGGVFTVPRPQDTQGRFYRQGELVGYVLDKPQLVARVVAPQDSVDDIRAFRGVVDVRLAHRPDAVLAGRLEREVPGGEEYLPSKVLATEGGGQLATDGRDARGPRTLERTFQFDVAVDPPRDGVGPFFFGERVHARFEHPDQPLGMQLLRSARRLFLSHFHV
jgi:putative peptide zinc metalloprotease protein